MPATRMRCTYGCYGRRSAFGEAVFVGFPDLRIDVEDNFGAEEWAAPDMTSLMQQISPTPADH